MDNQSLFVIVLLIIFLIVKNLLLTEGFAQQTQSLQYPKNIIDCSFNQTENECNSGNKCFWIKEKLKAYPLGTPYCTGNIFDV